MKATHHPPGKLTVSDRFISNVVPSCFMDTDYGIIELSVQKDVEPSRKQFVIKSPGAIPVSELRSMGFGDDRMNPLLSGKYVYFNDDSFIIAKPFFSHNELAHYLRKENVSIIGAGFVMVSPAGVELFGKSESLKNLKPRIDRRDVQFMSRHLLPDTA